MGIPRYLYVNSNDLSGQLTRNRDVLPDYPVAYSWEDLLQGRDKHWELVEALIGGNLAEEKKERE